MSGQNVIMHTDSKTSAAHLTCFAITLKNAHIWTKMEAGTIVNTTLTVNTPTLSLKFSLTLSITKSEIAQIAKLVKNFSAKNVESYVHTSIALRKKRLLAKHLWMECQKRYNYHQEARNIKQFKIMEALNGTRKIYLNILH